MFYKWLISGFASENMVPENECLNSFYHGYFARDAFEISMMNGKSASRFVMNISARIKWFRQKCTMTSVSCYYPRAISSYLLPVGNKQKLYYLKSHFVINFKRYDWSQVTWPEINIYIFNCVWWQQWLYVYFTVILPLPTNNCFIHVHRTCTVPARLGVSFYSLYMYIPSGLFNNVFIPRPRIWRGRDTVVVVLVVS